MTKSIAQGQRFERLTVVSLSARQAKNRHKYWNCICECGKTTTVQSTHLKAGVVRSCGCFRLEQVTTHGMSGTPEYRTWMSMIARCTNPNLKNYGDYGGRGIEVCSQWKESFNTFFADMGVRPSKAHSLDRIDNNLGYSPENCRWANRKTQNRNMRKNLKLEFRGEFKCLSEWAELLGHNRSKLSWRLENGWSVERAFTTP